MEAPARSTVRRCCPAAHRAAAWAAAGRHQPAGAFALLQLVDELLDLRVAHVEPAGPGARALPAPPGAAHRLGRLGGQRRRVELAQAVLDDELEIRKRVRLARIAHALLDVLQELDGLRLVALGLLHARLVVEAELLEAVHVDVLELLELLERVAQVLVLVRGVGLGSELVGEADALERAPADLAVGLCRAASP